MTRIDILEKNLCGQGYGQNVHNPVGIVYQADLMGS